MAIFGAMDTSSSGLRVYRTWLDAVSDNIANLNTVRRTSESAFRGRYVLAESVQDGDTGTGARVAGAVFGDPEGRLVYEPDHPLADEQGMVRYPSVDLSEQMTQLIMAQRGYQANLAVVERAKDAYQAALSLGGR
jgi:flagellar basal-body rod protein FlgC